MLPGLSSVILEPLPAIATGLSLLPTTVSVTTAVSVAFAESFTSNVKLSEKLEPALRLSNGVNRIWLFEMLTFP